MTATRTALLDVSRTRRGRKRAWVPVLAAIWGALVVTTAGCQSMSDGARQVSVSAQELGRRMSAPFKRNAPSRPSFDRAPKSGQRDPFLPPPRRPDEDEISGFFPQSSRTVLLGKPTWTSNSTRR